MPLERIEAERTELAGQLAAGECRWLLLVAEYDRREGYLQWGCRSCAQWLSWQCGLDARAAREKLRVGRALDDLPVIAREFAVGDGGGAGDGDPAGGVGAPDVVVVEAGAVMTGEFGAVGADGDEVAIRAAAEAPAALVDEAVVVPAELGEVEHGVVAAVGAVLEVVDVGEGPFAAAGEVAALVERVHGSAQ